MKNILVVDKTPSVHRIREIAQRLSVGVIEAASSVDAIRKLRDMKHNVELVIVDIMLEGEENGFSLIETMKKDAPTVPIVVLTSKSGKREIVRSLKLGVIDYILKPFDDGTIQNRVFSHISARNKMFDKTKSANQEGVKEHVRAEFLKAKKGAYPITLVAASFYNPANTERRSHGREYSPICDVFLENIKQVFFETDYVAVFEANTLLAVLPFCPRENLGIIDAKLEKKPSEIFDIMGIPESKMAVAYMSSPDECINESGDFGCMIDRLIREIDALIMLGKFSSIDEE